MQEYLDMWPACLAVMRHLEPPTLARAWLDERSRSSQPPLSRLGQSHEPGSTSCQASNDRGVSQPELVLSCRLLPTGSAST